MNESSDRPPHGSPIGFQTTHWSLVVEAAADSHVALEQLCATYWSPLFWHLRRLGLSQAQAEDLTQSFFARLLENRLLDVADARRGRFRTFLLTALKRFVINQWKHETAAKRGGGRSHVSLNVSDAPSVDLIASADLSPDKLFERQWAIVVLQSAFHNLEAEQIALDKKEEFESLVCFLTGNATSDTYDALARRLNSTPGALRMVVSRMRARLRELVRAEIRKTVQHDAEVDDELHSLYRALQP